MRAARAAIQFKLILRICGAIPQQIIPDRAQVLTRDEAFGFTMSLEATRRVSRLPRQPGSHHWERPESPIGAPEPACTRRPIHYQVEVAGSDLGLDLGLGFEDI
ncbi:hypothetical protein B5V03_15800 [Bradyrhizobium betae]|uniref:Uncharacterized protein n=1 Tax=Bradyrhizobium betae TaxID=244734 RepID=A0A4Q1V8G5_9BRAD|nr:hypothetical protein B5V03_15800 [Bradyrhizobium betae]